MSSPSPRRCARNTRRSSRPASRCRSTIRASPCITCSRPAKTSSRRAPGRAGGSRCSITRCATSRRERVRHHTCYGINMGPRTSDMELKHLADIIVTIRAGFYSFEMANPRHEHEWRVWEHVKLPDDKVLIPGCITHASVIVEHPELVAERILRLARIVGRERVIAGTDCGFASTLVPGATPGGRARDRLGEVQEPRRGRAARVPGAVGVTACRSAKRSISVKRLIADRIQRQGALTRCGGCAFALRPLYVRYSPQSRPWPTGSPCRLRVRSGQPQTEEIKSASRPGADVTSEHRDLSETGRNRHRPLIDAASTVSIQCR